MIRVDRLRNLAILYYFSVALTFVVPISLGTLADGRSWYKVGDSVAIVSFFLIAGVSAFLAAGLGLMMEFTRRETRVSLLLSVTLVLPNVIYIASSMHHRRLLRRVAIEGGHLETES